MTVTDIDALIKQRADYIASGRAQSYDDMTAVGRWFREAEVVEVVPCEECTHAHMECGFCKYCDLIKDEEDELVPVYFDGGHFCSEGNRKQ